MSDAGYSLRPESPILRLGQQIFAFTVTEPGGRPLQQYGVTHEKELHLIVVRRDLTGFQHLHPVRDEQGRWSTTLALDAAGGYRVFADFAPAGRADSLTLGVDVAVPGDYQPRPTDDQGRTAEVDGYTVALEGDLLPGRESDLRLRVSRAGQPVTDLQPYLGAFGHLVVLREGDLAYLHVHPSGEPGDGDTEPGPNIAFKTAVPTAGTYRLFLDFRHEGRVRRASFTVNAASDPVPATVSRPAQRVEPAPTYGTGHGH